MTDKQQSLRDIVTKMRYDCTAIQSNLTALMARVNALDIEDRPPLVACASCGVGSGLHLDDCEAAMAVINAAEFYEVLPEDDA